MSQTRKPINYEKKYNVKIEGNKVICLDCNKQVINFMSASGNKTTEGDCSQCGKIVRIPLEQYKEMLSK